MTTADRLRALLASVRSELAEALPKLTDDLKDAAPSPGMRTYHGQLVEIVASERRVLARLTGQPTPTFQEMETEYAGDSMTAMIAELDRVRAQTLAEVDRRATSGIDEVIDVNAGFRAYLGLEQVTAADLFIHIARHESYHVGQIVSYLWAAGDDPYTWD